MAKNKVVLKTKKPRRSNSALVGIFILFCAVVAIIIATSSQKLGVQISFEKNTNFSKEQQNIIVAALQEWDREYGCPRSIRIKVVSIPDIQTQTGSESTMAVAVPGEISVNTAIKISPEELKDVIRHEATHACKDDPILLLTPLLFSDGEILGYEGLSLLVRLSNGVNTKFTKCEEAMAERSASFLPGYVVHDPEYFALGNWARKLFPKGSGAEKLVQKNDFKGFAAKVLNIPVADVGEIQIEQVIKTCDQVAKSR